MSQFKSCILQKMQTSKAMPPKGAMVEPIIVKWDGLTYGAYGALSHIKKKNVTASQNLVWAMKDLSFESFMARKKRRISRPHLKKPFELGQLLPENT